MPFHLSPSEVWALAVIAALVVVDTLLAYAVAALTGTWKWSLVGQFVATNVFRYIGGGLVLAVVSQLHPSLQSLLTPVFWGAAVTVALKFLFGDIAAKAQALEQALTKRATAALSAPTATHAATAATAAAEETPAKAGS